MSILIKGMAMPKNCFLCPLSFLQGERLFCVQTKEEVLRAKIDSNCPLIELPPHGDLIDRDALIKDGWSALYKQVMRMGGYAIHELPLKNPSIPVVIESEGEE